MRPRMHRRTRAAALLAGLALAALAGCAADGGPGEAGAAAGDQLEVHTGQFMVASGDVFECFYTDVVTDRELAVAGTFGKQGPGGHHITVYYTERMQSPQHHPCVDQEMTQWRMVGGGGAGESKEASGQLALTDGLAIRVPAGVQIVLQSHYVNPGDAFMTDDTASVHLMDPDDVVDYVNQFLTIDVGFDVPPHQELESTTTCVVPRDLQIVRLLGHMHEWGSHYTLEEIDDQDRRQRVLIDEDWLPLYTSSPPVQKFTMEDPLVLKAGTRLRQTCSWRNDETEHLRFPREMCLSYGFYYPDGGEVTCEQE
jgi:hypothetical protein